MDNTTKAEREVHTPEFYSFVKGKKELIDYLSERGLDEGKILNILSRVSDKDDLEDVASRLASYIYSSTAQPNLRQFNAGYPLR